MWFGVQLSLTYITYVAWTESCTTSRWRVHKGTHRGAISYKSALDKETSEGGTVASSWESHWMGENQIAVIFEMYFLSCLLSAGLLGRTWASPTLVSSMQGFLALFPGLLHAPPGLIDTASDQKLEARRPANETRQLVLFPNTKFLCALCGIIKK